MDPSNIVLEFTGGDQGTLASRWLFSEQVDEPLEVEKYADASQPGSGTTYTLVGDHQGSIIQIVNTATGSRVAQYSYGAYGARSFDAADLVQPYGYTGREYDAESGLYHLRWRAYDPATGTFMQLDPLGFGGGQENLYAYVDNNPFNATDPMGLSAYFDYKATIDGRKQMLGHATRNVSSGMFSAVANMVRAMDQDWNKYAGSPKSAGSLGPRKGGGCHGNSGHNEGGQHIYVIYHRSTGQTAKVGIGKRKDLILDGALSKRAMRQIGKMGGPTKFGHVVLMTIPSGFMSRGQALIMEKMMVTMLDGLGMEVDDRIHKSPVADPKFCPFRKG
ncbi:RHS repeat-associated core domain-containing protein [Aliiroseovarius halocynthiae]|nr:RHS repeat-associated core domain-containing protein [Aliiroseovarius halocynthiae]SMR83577.1 RHS repeat-associated core domain-containing protein [Aliiroseovarius halocynthiae]